MKQEIIEQIQKLFENKKDASRNLIRKMIEPIVQQMGKEHLIEFMLDEIDDFMKPINKQVSAEGYEKFYTEEQLVSYCAFLKENQWFSIVNSEFATWLINETSLRTQPLYEELFKKYLNEDEDEEDEEDDDDDFGKGLIHG